MGRGGLFIVGWGFVRARQEFTLSGVRLCIETILCLAYPMTMHAIVTVRLRPITDYLVLLYIPKKISTPEYTE